MTSRSTLASATAVTTAPPRTGNDFDLAVCVLDVYAKSLYRQEMSQIADACRTVHGYKAGFIRAAGLMAMQRLIW